MSVERKNYSNSRFEFQLPELLAVQTNSFEQFLQRNVPQERRRSAGLEQVFREIFPIREAKGRRTLDYEGYTLGEPRYTFQECRQKGLTYAAPLSAQIRLTVYESDSPVGANEDDARIEKTITEEVSFGEVPLMTDSGSFLISGAERVVVSQLHRSPGVSFDQENADNKLAFRSRIIPQRGSWAEFFTEPSDILYISIDRRKKLPATLLLRALGFARNEDILALFYTSKEIAVADITEEEIANGKYILFSDCIDSQTGELLAIANSVLDNENVRKILDAGVEQVRVIAESVNDDPIIHKTLLADPFSKKSIANPSAFALQHIFEAIRNRAEDRSNLRSATEPSVEQLRQAKAYFNRLFFDDKSYDLGDVGRYRLTTRLYLDFIIDLLLQVVAKAPAVVKDEKLDLKQLKEAVVLCAELEAKEEEGENVSVEIAHAREARAVQIDRFIAYMAQFTEVVNGDNADRTTYEPNQVAMDQFVEGPLTAYLKQQASKEGRALTDAVLDQILPSGIIRSLLASLPQDRELVEGLVDSLYLGRTPALRRTMTRTDFVLIIGHMVALANGFEEMLFKFDADARIRNNIDNSADTLGSRPIVLDDIDHLGNRRVRSVGELLFSEVSRGLSKMARTIRDRLSHPEDEAQSPKDLINARAVSAAIQAFFGSSQLSQFMDQNNPLAELTNKRRMSALGPGGITRDRAGFEVRDVHYTHYGRLCPIETPEGPNIGLINSLASYARVNPLGFIETPYRKVTKGRVTDDVVYLTADQEDNYKIASAATALDDKGNITEEYVLVRMKGDFPVVPKGTVELMDVVPKQIVSIAAGLIPFLEHDDANRALMGSNMQRQAVPLLRAESPVVGTGLEAPAARDSGALVIAKKAGEVIYVDAQQIKVRRSEGAAEDLIVLGDVDVDTYPLRKFERSNQDTCINQKPIVSVGDQVEAGTVLADGASTEKGELALGRNIRIAFLPWNGYNFEDAIIISEEICSEDIFTSIHIEEFSVEVRETKRGPEELTREIPNVSSEAIKDLDEDGIIRVGAEVLEGDVMVGKITPKGELDVGPEVRLLRAIFNEKAMDVSDTSLKAPPGMKGVVVETRTFTRKERTDAEGKKADEAEIKAVREQSSEEIRSIESIRNEKLNAVLLGATSVAVVNAEVGDSIVTKGKRYTEALIETLGKSIGEVKEGAPLCGDSSLNNRAWKIILAAKQQISLIEERAARQIDKIAHGDELKPGVLKMVKVYVAKKRQLSVGDKMAGRHGNKGVVSKIVPVEDMPFTPDGEPVQILLNPLGVPSRMNVGQVLEVHLGWAAKALGIKVSTPVFEGATYEDVIEALGEANLPKSGKTHLIDGQTGEFFHTPVVVGYMYMLKLHHLVDEKMHARAIGHYALVTQQPLGGKSQFGGQRFGEMEVWALQAYGAAYTLQELLTIKSDDVVGRNKAYEAIVKDENLPEPGMPESFNVLIKEIQALGLDIKVGG